MMIVCWQYSKVNRSGPGGQVARSEASALKADHIKEQGPRIRGSKRDAKELQRFESLAKGIAEIERMLKALIKSLKNKPLNPWPLFSS